MILLNLHLHLLNFFFNLKSYSINKWHNYNYVIKPITFLKVTYLHSFLFAALKNDSIKRKPTANDVKVKWAGGGRGGAIVTEATRR